jgi:hypothetical protein
MKPYRLIVFTWLAWVLILIGFQGLATARFKPRVPDRALEWTANSTGEGYQDGRVYLLEPFMNDQVAWDSEYYLAIAIGGYDDPSSPHLTPQGVLIPATGHVISPYQKSARESMSLSYAFFPFYPLMIRLTALPLQILGGNEIATATLAGVIVSALGALVAMLALFDLTRDHLGEAAALRAAFYLIIFPTGFFLLQVYTEGLFAGLTFGCLAMLKRRQWLLAAVLAAAATLTRAVGLALVIPMLLFWLRSGDFIGKGAGGGQVLPNGFSMRAALPGLLTLSPLVTFLIWKFSRLGRAFDYIESNYFGRSFLSLSYSFRAWADAFQSMLNGANPQHTVYYMTEFLGLAIGLAACLAILRSQPEIALFSLAVILISWGSGPPQGIHRYVLGAPALFIALARWGEHPVFDRAWTILSILLMGLLAMLFGFNMWVA